MVTVSIDEAQKDLRNIIARANAGEEVVITEDGVTVAHLAQASARPHHRVIGFAKGEFTIPPEFDDPLPEDMREAFGA
jgi:prevent-host-death family protein